MSASSKKALVGALLANVAIAATKFVVAVITRSSVMAAEGIHSLVDTGNSGLMLFGGKRSRRPADEKHPFGYGMELYFWSLVVAMVVFAGGGGLSIYDGVRALVHPHDLTAVWANYVVLAASAVFESTSLVIGAREFAAYRREYRFTGSALQAVRTSKNPAMFLTVLEDSAALVGLAIAAIGITLSHYLHIAFADGLASILIGCVLMLEALLIGTECRGLLIGEPARRVVATEIRLVLESHPDLGPIERVRTLQLGADAILVFIALRAGPAKPPDVYRRMSRDLHARIPVVRDVFLEVPGDQGAGKVEDTPLVE